MGIIDNKTNYRSRTLVTGYDAQRRIGEDDYVNNLEVGYFVEQVRRLAGSSGSIIDVGAGTGKLSLAFAELGYAVTAFDQSEAMLERLEAKARDKGLTITCRLGDIVDEASGEATGPRYDVAVSSRVLMHVVDPDAMIARMAALSRRGIVLDAPRHASPNRLLTMMRRLTGGEVYRCFDDQALRDSVARQGLRVINATPLFTLPIGFHLLLGNRPVSAALERGLAAGRGFASTLFLAAERL